MSTRTTHPERNDMPGNCGTHGNYLNPGSTCPTCAERIKNLEHVLGRVEVLLNHLVMPETGRVRRALGCRWAISDEPLRCDAENLLPIIHNALK